MLPLVKILIYHFNYRIIFTHMNSVKQPCSSGVLTAQWIEYLSGVQEVMSTLIPVGNSDLFFVSHSCHVEQVTFHRIIFYYA